MPGRPAIRFVVLGAGAIGAYVGASLARGGADVLLVARGPHLRAMQAHGVSVLSKRGDFHVRVAATDNVDAVSEADVVFVGLKAHSLPEVSSELGRNLRPGAVVVAAQNGIPWWYFQAHPGPLENLVLESVDPRGVVTAAIDPAGVIGKKIRKPSSVISAKK